MVYAYDQWAQMPVKDLYDTQIMAMSIAAARDMYEKGQKQLEDFNNKYGDFMSPIAKDMDWYNQNVTGKVRDTINNLYANGIDPLRSAEGRAAVAQLIYSMPTGEIAKLRQSADAAKEYIKNRGILEAAGKWDPNFERFANQGSMLEDWDTMSNGVWNRTSPAELKTLKEVTEDWYNQRQAHMLDKAGVESFNMKYDPRYNYKGFTDQDLLDIAAGQTPGWNGSIYADYYRDVAKQMVVMNKIANGDNSPVTASDIEKQLQRNIATANREYLITPIKEADQFALDNHRTANDIKAAGAKAAIDFAYDKKRLTDPVFAAAAAGSGKGGKKDQFKPNIFREAEANADNVKAGVGGKFGYGVYSGDHVGYVPSGQYAELIDPIIPGSYVLAKDKNSDQQVEMWKFNNTRVLNNIYTIDQYGKVQKAPISNNFGSTSYTFIPDGQIKAAKAGNSYRYYVSGTLKGDKNTSPIYNPRDNNSTQLWIEVKERGYSYDGK